MNQNEFREGLKRAELVEGILSQGAGYDAAIVGGALRVQALGGTTGDFDIAVIVNGQAELDALNRDITSIVLPSMGLRFSLQHYSTYGDNDGFLADWRYEDINIIAYLREAVTDMTGLINKFDLNINQWYFNEAGELVNDHFSKERGLVQINPYRDALGHTCRLKDRIERFKEVYPFLDWSEIDARKVQHPIYGDMYE